MTLWLLGDQLSTRAAALDGTDHVLLIESHDFAGRLPYHPAKLTLLFSAMRHVRDELRDRGHEVTYIEAETFDEGLATYFEAAPGDALVMMEPPSHGAAGRFETLVDRHGGSLTLVENDCFLTTPAQFDAWAGERTVEDGFRQERWYRFVRRELDVLMDGDEPEGGEWNYDDQNRETPDEGWTPPPVPRFEPDELTREVHEWVTTRYDDHWGNASLDEWVWPTTRAEAQTALEHFVEHRLPAFGPYQDALVDGEWALSHSLLSTSINLGLLHPQEAVDAAVDAYENGDAPLNSVEGFVRQVIGWREFMRHVYRRAMPEMASANQLDQREELPPLYWDGETEMKCLDESVSHVYDRGYAHHIERLMVLSNFALIYGVDPQELNRWFHLGFVDAFHWVTTPNVVGMGSFATDVLSSKPYASSGNYINKMSDFCADCAYTVSRTTGEGACPFNALYWDFLKENEELLRGTGRMGLMYSHVDKKDEEEWTEIRERAEAVREMAREGEL